MAMVDGLCPTIREPGLYSSLEQPPLHRKRGKSGSTFEAPSFDMLNAELTEFARCIRDRGRRYPVPIADVLHGMSVFDAIVRAARSNSIEQVVGRISEA